MTSEDIQTLLTAARAGDELAASRIFQMYLRRLLGLAQSRLSPQMARRVEAEDIVQSAMRTFFRRLREDGMEWGENVDLWQLLARITVRKVCGQVDHHYAQRRSVADEQNAESDASGSDRDFEAFARGPTASDLLIAQELLDRVMAPLEPKQRKILELRLEGYSYVEISAQLGCSEAIARRLVDKVKQSLEAEF